MDVPLGRWTRTTEKENAIKVFWANVDHCGTCSSQAMSDAQTKAKVDPVVDTSTPESSQGGGESR